MDIEVNGELYEVKIKIGTVRKLDRLYKVNEQGMEMGMGVTLGYTFLDTYSIGDLAKILPILLDKKMTVGQVDKFIEDYAEENDGLSGLFEGLKDALRESKLTKDTVGNYLGNLEEE